MNGFVSLDTASPVPPFEQIRSRVAELIVSGALASGQRLPAVRQLAGDLRVAPGTVARAYKELETAGLLVTRRGAGTRVAPGDQE
ncbi:MAG: GntR family transcriptional regulator, partial [Actinomyces dentalis]